MLPTPFRAHCAMMQGTVHQSNPQNTKVCVKLRLCRKQMNQKTAGAQTLNSCAQRISRRHNNMNYERKSWIFWDMRLFAFLTGVISILETPGRRKKATLRDSTNEKDMLFLNVLTTSHNCSQQQMGFFFPRSAGSIVCFWCPKRSGFAEKKNKKLLWDYSFARPLLIETGICGFLGQKMWCKQEDQHVN